MVRVGVVGARRRREGIGEYVAGHLAALGAEVSAIVGTSTESLLEAEGSLRRRHGLQTRGYLSLPEMLATERLDAVAICSPERFHRKHLTQALEARVHVLCEKPLVFDPGRDGAEDARRLAGAFLSVGRVLAINAQWPYTLEAFGRLYPSWRRECPPRRLRVTLSPAVAGPAMIPNSLPHAISLLLALAPASGETADIRIDVRARNAEGAASAAMVSFVYRHAQGATAVDVELTQTPHQPRPAGYAIDGMAVRRRIEQPGYRLFLDRNDGATPGASTPMDDPLKSLLADFLRRCRPQTDPAPLDPALVEGQRILEAVYRAAREVL